MLLSFNIKDWWLGMSKLFLSFTRQWWLVIFPFLNFGFLRDFLSSMDIGATRESPKWCCSKHFYSFYCIWFCYVLTSLNFLCSFVELQICYFFYKNIAFGLTIFYFEAFAGFSGQSVYDDWFMLLFNVVLTSLPVISLGVFEQDVSSEICLQVYDRTSNLV